jgi:peptide/nickel transport system substrate-binding protein
METGEMDYAWNLQLAPDVIAGWLAAAAANFWSFGTLVERIEINMTDPSPNLPEGEIARPASTSIRSCRTSACARR